MTNRLQVLLPDQQQPVNDKEAKLKAVRRGAELDFPSADIDQLLSEIEQGYRA